MSSRLTSTDRLPELLAPAGNLETALTAYKSGADAVYFGLEAYNARIPAENFSVRDLSRLAAYAKRHGKKYYITFNTLVKQSELEDAAVQLETIAQYEPDAVIVQDIGIVHMIREFFPMMPVHASTQMGIHNSAGVEVAGDLGIERVILERQITFEELEMIVARSPIEIEIFVHGALCCSLSGKCLFSSWIGGWSGNRGRCKQPCRRRYHSTGNGNKQSGFLFSTQDLYMLDLVPELKRIGVDSLKIEGRLKKPDYVQGAVSAYRMMLDCSDEESGQVLKRAKQVLSGSYGRRWSHGFASPDDMKMVVQPDSVGVSGLLVGNAEGVTGNSLRVNVSRKIHVGDRIRVQRSDGQESPSFTVRELQENRKNVKSCSKGLVLIPIEGDVPDRGKVYKVGQSIKRRVPQFDSLEEFVPRRIADLHIAVSAGNFTVTLMDSDGNELLHWERPVELEKAEKHPIDSAEIERVFITATPDPLRTGRMTIEVQEGLFLPPSLLKQLRREFKDFAAGKPVEARLQGTSATTVDRLKELLQSGKDDRRGLPRRISCAGQPSKRGSKSGLEGGSSGALKGGLKEAACTVRVDDLYSFTERSEEVELPHFCSEGAIGTVQKKIEQAVRSGIRTFRITDIYQLSLLRQFPDLELSAAYPLPVANSLVMKELKRMGLRRCQAWIELDRGALEQLVQAAPLNVELYRYGRPFILATRARLSANGAVTDSRGKKFILEYSPADTLSYLYPDEIMSIPAIPGTDEFRDHRKDSRGEKNYSSFNFEKEYI